MPEDRFDFKVNSDGGHEGGCKRVVGVTEQEASLADTRITDNE